MMASPGRADDRQKARIAKVEEKWNTLFNQKTRPPIYNVPQYIEYLRKYTSDKQNTGFQSEQLDNGQGQQPDDVHPVSYLLQKLKLDLKMSYQWFIEDFVRKPNDGLSLLIVLLKNIQKASKEVSTTPTKAKMKSKKRLLFDEHDCLICIKFCLRVFDAGVILLDASYGLESVASTLMSSHTKSRVVALEIMSLILREPDGFQRNLDCFTYFRLKNGEPARFKFLISMLMSRGTNSLAFQICCMRYLNSLLTAAPSTNIRVFLQEELDAAGVDTNVLLLMTEDLNLPDNSTLMKEVLDYRNNRIDIDYLLEKQKFLQQQISRLTFEMNGVKQSMEREKSTKKRHAPLPPPTPTPVPPTPPPAPTHAHAGNSHPPDQPDHPLQQPIGNVTTNHNTVDKMYACLAELRSRNIRRTSGTEHTVQPEVHPTHQKIGAIAPRRNMPFLNWVPLTNVEGTIFKNFDYERVLEEIEIFDLEENFRIGNHVVPSKQENPKGHGLAGKNEKIRFMDPARAKNLAILQRRIGRTPEDVRQFIQEYDVDALLPDNAELLLKFIPTEEEMRVIMTLDFDFHRLDAAEQMLLQLMSIERLEDKLKLMLFMDQFYQTREGLRGPTEEIRSASMSLSRCVKLRRIFEIILALGNFINGNRKGHAVGFRVTSLPLLEEIRSSDKSKTLLAYVTEVVERHYFEVHDWYDDVEVQLPFKASYHSVSTSVKEMREGMKILDREADLSNSPRLLQFQREAIDTMSLMETDFNEMEQAYKEVCAMFGENHLTMDSADFFKILFRFAEEYKKADKQLSRKRWRKGISLNFDPKKYPTPHRKYEEAPVRPERRHSNSYNNESEETFAQFYPVRSSTSNIPVTYSENHEFKSFTYDSQDVMLTKEQITPQETTYDNWMVNCTQLEQTSEPTVENWIVCSPPPEKCTDVLREECQAKMLQLEEGTRDLESESIFDCDSESNDSAFVGSEGQYLKSTCSKSNDDDLKCGGHSAPVTSTPRTTTHPPPEPIPDYPAEEDVRKNENGELEDEITRVLNDFEGDLNGYCSTEVSPAHRRFVTIRSIIYL